MNLRRYRFFRILTDFFEKKITFLGTVKLGKSIKSGLIENHNKFGNIA